MVRGLDLFRQHFAADADRYVLIGGVAASVLMDEAGLEFRATKDLDIVLIVEMLDAGFGERLWEFIRAGGYQIRQASDGSPRLYRLMKPANQDYPYMIELFSRRPEGVELTGHATLTPIPVDEAVSSLSAILMDDEAYAFLREGRVEIEGLSIAQADRLIPLKAMAWLDLTERVAQGETIDGKNVSKHLADVFRLAPLLGGETRVALPPRMTGRFEMFLKGAAKEQLDLRAIKATGGTQGEIVDRLARIFGAVSPEVEGP